LLLKIKNEVKNPRKHCDSCQYDTPGLHKQTEVDDENALKQAENHQDHNQKENDQY